MPDGAMVLNWYSKETADRRAKASAYIIKKLSIVSKKTQQAERAKIHAMSLEILQVL